MNASLSFSDESAGSSMLPAKVDISIVVLPEPSDNIL
jgi:hypothetical protein